MEGNDMHTIRTKRHRMLAALSATVLVVGGCASRTPSAKPGPTGELQFSSPKAAVDALFDACRKNDEARLIAIFGERVRPYVSTGDPATDQEKCALLLNAANESMRLDPKGPNTLQLVVGSDDWPFPIPLVMVDKAWHFDTAEGMKEVRRRRVGADELEAIKACHTYVLAQREHAAHTKGAFSRELVGKRFGWPTMDRETVAPLTKTDVAPSGKGPQATWRGYHYRILAGKGGMYPLIAYPVEYGWSGVMTFVVAPDGTVYQRDLGAQTAQSASMITKYDADSSWTRVN
jgi:hypothetical protein